MNALPAQAPKADENEPKPSDTWMAAITVVRHFQLTEKNAVLLTISGAGFQPILVNLQTKKFYSENSIRELPKVPEGLKLATKSIDVKNPPDPDLNWQELDVFLWVIGSFAFSTTPAPWLGDEESYILKSWPNLSRFPHTVDELRLISMLASNLVTIDTLASANKVGIHQTAALISKLSLLELLKTNASTSAEPPVVALVEPPVAALVEPPAAVKQSVKAAVARNRLPKRPLSPEIQSVFVMESGSEKPSTYKPLLDTPEFGESFMETVDAEESVPVVIQDSEPILDTPEDNEPIPEIIVVEEPIQEATDIEETEVESVELRRPAFLYPSFDGSAAAPEILTERIIVDPALKIDGSFKTILKKGETEAAAKAAPAAEKGFFGRLRGRKDKP